jgi:DNA-binding response OmpR family regulator
MGVGTTFTLLLPAATRSQESQAGLPPGDKALLLVDDDDDWRRFAQAAWESAGYRVQAAAALAGVDLMAFDRIIVDQTLEQINALDVLYALRKAGAKNRALVVTSNLVVEQTTGLLQAGAQDVLLKPYTLEELATLL